MGKVSMSLMDESFTELAQLCLIDSVLSVIVGASLEVLHGAKDTRMHLAIAQT